MLNKLLVPLLFLLLIYLGLSEPLFSANQKEDKPKKEKIQFGLNEKIHTNQWSVEFWNNLRIVPVKFVGKEKDHLVAQFTSDLMVRQINFTVLPERAHSFFKLSGGWEDEIDAKQFAKEMKKDFWIVIYFAESENIIYEAHQFKSWAAVNSSFPPNPQQITKSNKTLDYWSRLRMSLLYFYYMEGDEANWIFFSATDTPADPSDNEILEFKNNFKIRRRSFPSKENTGLEVLENGTFTIDERCSFSTIEVRNPKILRASLPLIGGAIKTKSQPVSRDYFLKNTEKSLWLCFYDVTTQKLVRAAERKNVKIVQEEPLK
jgi:hypothetical protein